MITLEATKQVADDSPDHICPVGAVRDNFTSAGLIEEVKYGFDNEQIAMLDLGCAGAQFVVDFINKGDIGVGLEGSSTSLTGVGKENWDKYHNKNLFYVILQRTINSIKMVNLWSLILFTLKKSLNT